MNEVKSPKSHWLVFENQHLLLKKQNAHYSIPCFSESPGWLGKLQEAHKIGRINEIPCYCAEIFARTDLPDHYEWVSFKAALELIQQDYFNVVAKAIQILNWEKNHQYCGRCGQKTVRNPAVFERSCKICNLFFYPRISPSIIVLIKKGKQLLMARNFKFPPGIYALIAGFVEPGESVEDALHREVMEEVGITVKNIQYFGSQAWPFPDSLMLAFTAEYESGEITLDNNEIESAGWYDVNNLPGMPSSRISIARKLIDNFIDEQEFLRTKP